MHPRVEEALTRDNGLLGVGLAQALKDGLGQWTDVLLQLAPAHQAGA